MIRDLARRFVDEQVLPRQDRLERQDWAVSRELLQQCGALGLIGIEIPERYGGSNLDQVSASIVAGEMSGAPSFAVTHGGQAGIGTLPILYFGSEAVKSRYLPGICGGDLVTAYALSEAGSASDALAARATARAGGDAEWILHGEKVWITNASFADLFVTFAQVDGNLFTGFLVERGYRGVSTGAEEHKMGLKGSSTCSLRLDDVPVPADNVLGEIGRGSQVAFGTLNTGRAKLGAMTVGMGRAALAESLRYARQRTAFGRPIGSFGAIRHKLAEMALRLWVVESMVYRTAHLLHGIDPEFAMECSILKVAGSEALDYAVDEAVQIFGGYGFTSDYPVERYYRDARVFRIFEGTSEINRLLIGGLLFKRHVFARAVSPLGPLAEPRQALERLTRAAADRFGDTVREEQELLMLLADIAIDIYAMESALARAAKSQSPLHRAMTDVFVHDARHRLRANALQAGAIVATPQTERLAPAEYANTAILRRRIAEELLDAPA